MNPTQLDPVPEPMFTVVGRGEYDATTDEYMPHPARTYEVTLPVVVTVTGDIAADVKLDPGWPGFFSEAEDASGVWDPAREEWGCDEDDHDEQDAVYRVAAAEVRRRLGLS